MRRMLLLPAIAAMLIVGIGPRFDMSRADTGSNDGESGIRLLKPATASAAKPNTNASSDCVTDESRIEYLPLPTPQEAKILDVLASRASFRYNKVTLAQFVREFGEATGINVVVDRRELEDFGIFVDEETVTVDLKNVAVRDALDFVLNPLNLSYEIEGDSLMITSWQEADELLYFRLYLVRDLIEQPGGAVDGNWLIHLITTHIEIDSWDPVGLGTITVYPQAYVLAVNQTRSAHDQVLGVLRMLRQARRISGVGGTESRFFPSAARRRPTLSLPVR